MELAESALPSTKQTTNPSTRSCKLIPGHTPPSGADGAKPWEWVPLVAGHGGGANGDGEASPGAAKMCEVSVASATLESRLTATGLEDSTAGSLWRKHAVPYGPWDEITCFAEHGI